MQKNVLLIESDTSFARAMSKALESRGYGVRTSPDGKEGFELARALHPDCVVLCVELPGLSGYSWCNRLKKDGDLKSIPLVITSSEATPETFDQHRKLKTRAEDYLLKPFPPETLADRVGALVGLPDPSSADGDELVTLDDVELEAGGAAATPADEDDADLKMLDDAFDSISRGGDEPSSLPPGTNASEPPLTLMPDADESPALSEFDREMAAALASLAEEAAEASKADPFAPSVRKVEPAVESVAQEETPILLEDVEVLPAVDENAAAALEAAQQEAAALRAELAAAREESEAIRRQAEEARVEAARSRQEAERLQTDVDRLQADADRVQADADRVRDDAGRLRGEVDEAQRLLAVRDAEAATSQVRLQEAAEKAAHAEERAASQDGELAAVRARLSEAEMSATARGAELVEAEKRAEDLERELDGARAEVEGLRNEVATRGATADGLRGQVEALEAAVASLRGEAESLRAEASAQRSEAESFRAQLDTLRAEAESFRAGSESARAEAESLRSEAESFRAEAEAFRAEAEERATGLSRRVQELESTAAQHEERVLRAYQKIKSDEKLREKTRKALAMVLQVLEERPGGDGGT